MGWSDDDRERNEMMIEGERELMRDWVGVMIEMHGDIDGWL